MELTSQEKVSSSKIEKLGFDLNRQAKELETMEQNNIGMAKLVDSIIDSNSREADQIKSFALNDKVLLLVEKHEIALKENKKLVYMLKMLQQHVETQNEVVERNKEEIDFLFKELDYLKYGSIMEEDNKYGIEYVEHILKNRFMNSISITLAYEI